MSNNRNNDGGLGCIIMLMMCVVAMPIVGIYMASKGEGQGEKMLGITLTVVGIIVWIKLGVF